MRSSLRLFLLLPLTATLACGSSSPTASAGLFPPPSGDWVLNVAPQTSSAGYFYGSLGTTGASSVAGVLHYYNPGTVCVPVTQDVPFTGIINTAGNVLGLMPHPERVVETVLGPADGLPLFESLLAQVAA